MATTTTNTSLCLNHRVLSIQSFVVHGYVGNKCSMFALQALGVDVDPLCTVQFSNHTGYPKWRGQITSGEMLWELFQGLCDNNLADYTFLLTGYCRDAEALSKICDIYHYLKNKNPSLFYVCDPVMGDNNNLYVPVAVAEMYKHTVVKYADVLLPNQTECEYLTGIPLTTESAAVSAMNKLHEMGAKTVIVTSIVFPEEPDTLFVFGSTSTPSCQDCFKIAVPRISGYFSGTGDIFGALMAAWTAKGLSSRDACLHTVCTIRAILMRTSQSGSKELKLLQSVQDIVNPPLYLASLIDL
ncbi:pyridoxal kinase [Pelomyxa schiedti]|nr:pyridoxal kinase [Pelomyxa schiedti]